MAASRVVQFVEAEDSKASTLETVGTLDSVDSPEPSQATVHTSHQVSPACWWTTVLLELGALHWRTAQLDKLAVELATILAQTPLPLARCRSCHRLEPPVQVNPDPVLSPEDVALDCDMRRWLNRQAPVLRLGPRCQIRSQNCLLAPGSCCQEHSTCAYPAPHQQLHMSAACSDAQSWLCRHGFPLPTGRLTSQQAHEIRDCFDLLDEDSSGALDVTEFRRAFRLLGLKVSLPDVQHAVAARVCVKVLVMGRAIPVEHVVNVLIAQRWKHSSACVSRLLLGLVCCLTGDAMAPCSGVQHGHRRDDGLSGH